MSSSPNNVIFVKEREEREESFSSTHTMYNVLPPDYENEIKRAWNTMVETTKIVI